MKHGGDLTEAMAHYGESGDVWLDLSTGINPWPWSVPAMLPDAAWRRLPSRADDVALSEAARAAYLVPAGIEIVAAPGTQALIQWLPQLAAPGTVAIVGPTYSEHALAWTRAGHDVANETKLDRLAANINHVVVVNPNNPDGRLFDVTTLQNIAVQLAERGGWLVIDEAFMDLDPACSAATLCRDLPVVILRSFGKFYGLAGLRLGFAIATPGIAASIRQALGPWAVSGPALVIGQAALHDIDWANVTRDRLRQQAARLDAVLITAGFTIEGGTSLFRLARHTGAQALHAELAQHHIWSRRFGWRDDVLRFGCPDDAGLERLATVLAEIA